MSLPPWFVKPMPRLRSVVRAVREPPLRLFTFLLAPFGLRRKSSASIIGRVCAFDAKIYKNVGGVFDVSSGRTGNKKNFQISDFCSALPSLLVEKCCKNRY
jgi:hypothetical protein